jgi:hypothetical protein
MWNLICLLLSHHIRTYIKVAWHHCWCYLYHLFNVISAKIFHSKFTHLPFSYSLFWKLGTSLSVYSGESGWQGKAKFHCWREYLDKWIFACLFQENLPLLHLFVYSIIYFYYCWFVHYFMLNYTPILKISDIGSLFNLTAMTI